MRRGLRITREGFILVCLLGAATCKSSAGDGGDGGAGGSTGPAEVTFPAGFLWGSATAGFQVEKGDLHTDWAHWAATAGKIKNGDNPDTGGPDALAHVDDDVKALTDSGQNAYRFSLEWARFYPTRAAFDADTPDAAAVAAYDALFAKLAAAHITPMVTLAHFSLPDWLSDVTHPEAPQGWERPETTDLFTEFTKRMATRYGKSVDYWITVNEPLNLALGGYVQGSFPPGLALQMDRAFVVVKAQAIAHTRAFDAIHAADTIDADGDGQAARVSFAAHQRTYHPLDASEPDDVAAAKRVQFIANRWFLDVVVKGNWDDDLDEKLDGPKDKTADPALKGRCDYVGVNYYSDTLISAHRGVVIPIINAAIYQDNLKAYSPSDDRATTDFAWDIYPEGLGAVLDEAATYGRPIIITENGIADASDANRPRFLLEHLYQLGWAKQRGVDVRGYFHWALVDNFEWANGFCPRFGLYTYDKATGARTARASVATYHRVISEGKVTRAQVDAAPPYVPPSVCR